MFREPSTDRNLNATLDVDDAHENYTKSSIKQSNSFGNLTDSSRNVDHGFNMDNTTMRRNRSFWRFSKSEDILEGMALWKHRDLMPIDAENADKEMTLKKQMKPSKKIEAFQKEKMSTNAVSSKLDANKRSHDQRERAKSMTKESKNGFMHQDDEIYDESPKRRNDLGPSLKSQSKNTKSRNYSDKYQDTNFYDDDETSVVIKTVKRKEILKQYYSSGTDTELSSSDPYDCIVVDDHLVPSTSNFRNRNSYAGEPDKRGSTYSRSNKNEVPGTLLPRTKLTRPSRADSNDVFDTSERTNTAKSNKASNNRNNFGPWSNMWPDEKSFHWWQNILSYITTRNILIVYKLCAKHFHL